MNYMEYCEKHDKENMSWCKPFADENEENWIILYEGSVDAIVTPFRKYDYKNGLADYIHEFAMDVNKNYNNYHGWTDDYIALDVMHETGCAYCPLRHDCDCMYEEIENGEEN